MALSLHVSSALCMQENHRFVCLSTRASQTSFQISFTARECEKVIPDSDVFQCPVWRGLLLVTEEGIAVWAMIGRRGEVH